MVSVNLLPQALRTARRRRRRMRGWSSAILVAALLAAVPVLTYVARTAQAGTLAKDCIPLRAELGEVVQETDRLTKANARLSSRLAQANALRSKRGWSDLLQGIADRLPEQVWLVEINTLQRTGLTSLARRGPANSAADASDDRVVRLAGPIGIRLRGYALDHEWLYELMTRLKATSVFKRVELIEANREQIRAAQTVRFVLECEW